MWLFSLNLVGEGDCHYVDQERGQKWPHVTSRARPPKAILLPCSLGTLAFIRRLDPPSKKSSWVMERPCSDGQSWLSLSFVLPGLASDISEETVLELDLPTLVL